MADWFNITEAMTDPFAPGTSELWKAWWKNPIAIAEGDPGAPRVMGKALGGVSLGAVLVNGTTGVGWTGLDGMGLIVAHFAASDGSNDLRLRFSADNGATYGAWQLVVGGPFTTPVVGAHLRVNIQTGIYTAIISTGMFQGTFTVPTGCNAFQVSFASGGTNGVFDALCLGGLE